MVISCNIIHKHFILPERLVYLSYSDIIQNRILDVNVVGMKFLTIQSTDVQKKIFDIFHFQNKYTQDKC